MRYVNILSAPLEIYGLAVKEEGKFYRLPENIIDKVNDRVTDLAKNTAGACVRFRTDSNNIEVKVTNSHPEAVSLHNACGCHGVDVYFDKNFAGVARPLEADKADFSEVLTRPFYVKEGELHDIQINLPLYDGICHMEIGIEDGAQLLPPSPRAIKKQVVFYGSSITQGAYASKAGNSYVNMLSRRLDFPLYCLGFAGSAHGEKIMAEYIASLDMAAFVMDYDHNDDVPELAERHEPFFKIIRAAHPTLPIILPSRPDFERKALNRENREVVRATYNNAIAAGDKNVYFIDGETFFGTEDRGAFTLDGVHPTDLGMRAMADTMYPILQHILYNK